MTASEPDVPSSQRRGLMLCTQVQRKLPVSNSRVTRAARRTRQGPARWLSATREVAYLLPGPETARVGGHAEDVHVARADLNHEQAVQALEGYCAADVEEVGGEHRRCLGVQELQPGRIGMPFRRRGDLQGLEDPADGGRADLVAELEQLALDPLVPQPLFSVASRSISAVISALTAGRPVRRG